MKKLIAFAFVIMSLMSCEDQQTPGLQVSPELSTYVNSFYQEASDRNIPIQQTVSVVFADKQASVQFENVNGRPTLFYSRELFDWQNELQRQQTICFHFGKYYLNRSAEDGAESFMNYSLVWEEAQREALFNELFQ